MKLCECGCGRPTRVAAFDHSRNGHVKGQPVRFVKGHRSKKSLAEKMTENVTPATDLSPNGMGGCLLWTGYVTAQGYGRVSDGGPLIAHRVSYQRAHGPIPEGLTIDHLCQRRNCVNPDHLEPVTNRENIRRGARTRLTLEQVAEIRYLASAGWNRAAVAGAYGVSYEHVRSICAGRYWKP